jgi:multimeric flavodoxin WrbA
MSSPVVVVTFYSRSGQTERLATAAAVGAVQARAGIRMRRLADENPAATLGRHPESRESLERMHKEYVPPREADVLAADALIFGLPADMSPASAECASYFALLSKLHAEGKLKGKAAAVVGASPACDAARQALSASGLTVVVSDASTGGNEVERAIALGRRVVDVAASLRSG